MRLIYLSNERFPSRDAVSIQQMQNLEAFGRTSLAVTFLRPYFIELAKYSKDEICDFYGVARNFEIVTLPSLLSLSKPMYGVDMGYDAVSKRKKKIPFIGGFSLMLATWIYIFREWAKDKFNKPTIIYSRNLNAAYVFMRFRERWFKNKEMKIFVEAHALSQKPEHYYDYIIQHCDGIVSITQSLKNALVEKYNLDEKDIFVAPDGVKTSWLQSQKLSKREIRKKLQIPDTYQKVVVYSGGFSPGKGVEILIRAAAEFDEKVMFYLLGGAPRTIKEVQQMTESDQYNNVHFAGFIPPRDIALYQAAADVLILPNTSDYALRDYTSPLKLFEYMASECPIVASDLPVFREVLRHQENCLLVPPGDPHALAEGIRRFFSDKALATRTSHRARVEVEKYTWDIRVQKIISFIQEKTGWKIFSEK